MFSNNLPKTQEKKQKMFLVLATYCPGVNTLFKKKKSVNKTCQTLYLCYYLASVIK